MLITIPAAPNGAAKLCFPNFRVLFNRPASNTTSYMFNNPYFYRYYKSVTQYRITMYSGYSVINALHLNFDYYVIDLAMYFIHGRLFKYPLKCIERIIKYGLSEINKDVDAQQLRPLDLLHYREDTSLLYTFWPI